MITTRSRPLAPLAEPVTRGRSVYTTADGLFEIHHEDSRGTPWATCHLPTGWVLLDGFRRLNELRHDIATGAIWVALAADARRVLDLPVLARLSGGTNHDHAHRLIAWLGGHVPHCLAEASTVCECGGGLAYVAGSWGHTTIPVCPTPTVVRCSCPHRQAGYDCDEPVRVDVECAVLRRRRVCCGRCWEGEA